VGRVLAAGLIQLPAAWVLTGIVVAAFGVAPRLAAAGWAFLVAFVVLGDQWVMNLSPFTHTPRLPGDTVHVAPVLWLTTTALTLAVAGLVGFRRRDMT
jgi:ABC-2 type transport system permease protein